MVVVVVFWNIIGGAAFFTAAPRGQPVQPISGLLWVLGYGGLVGLCMALLYSPTLQARALKPGSSVDEIRSNLWFLAAIAAVFLIGISAKHWSAWFA
jgi:hypothetical protein